MTRRPDSSTNQRPFTPSFCMTRPTLVLVCSQTEQNRWPMSTTQRQIKPHSLNRDFIWHTPEPSGLRYLSANQYRAFNENGFVKLKGVFTRAEVEAVIAAIDPIEQKG